MVKPRCSCIWRPRSSVGASPDAPASSQILATQKRLANMSGENRVGYDIPINRHFYVYKPPRPLDEIEADIARLEGEIAGLLKGLIA